MHLGEGNGKEAREYLERVIALKGPRAGSAEALLGDI
jgi:hypothetical protein